MTEKSRSAGIYSRRNQYFIYPFSRTTSGLLMGGSPVLVLEHRVGDDELGRALLSALSRYRAGIEHPRSFEGLPDPILAAARVKSLSAFAKGAVSCTAREETSQLTIVPSQRGELRGETRGTFLSVPEREVVVALPADPEEVGTALREAIARCS